MVAIEAEVEHLVTGGRVDSRIDTDPAIFDVEMDRIFGQVWLYAAHESQLRDHGDFIRTQLGRYEVIAIRGGDGVIRALHNRCTHRGARLCADGTLAAVLHEESYPPGFDMADPAHRLQQVARVESYRGFVFASLAAEGPSLVHYLGEMTAAIDNLLDRAPDGEVSVAASSFQLEYRGNW